MISRPLRFASFLAPAMLPVYEFISRHVGRRLGVATELTVGRCYDELADADVSFVCGLAAGVRGGGILDAAEEIV